ncbi:MAG: acyltransferase [Gammaproteobacteria bacterium]|nr:acyltransferase [Gammaproteobacteria bacterium]
MTTESPKKSNSIEGVQYLRGVAALMVVFFHSRSYFTDLAVWTGVGARGVDIFFVISGFIMAHSTRHIDHASSIARESLAFLTKRIIRVVPLYWVALLWTSGPYWIDWLPAATSPLDIYQNHRLELTSLIKDFFFIPHVSLDPDEDGEAYPIVIQGWTLNYEMFFYALFALSMFFRKYRLIAASLVLITLVLSGRMYRFSDVPTLFYTSKILIEFVFGMMVFHVYTKTQHVAFDRKTLLVLGVIGFVLLNSGSVVNDKFVLAPAAAIITLVFIHAFRDAHFRSLKILGDASYSIYLFHPAVFEFVRWFIRYIGLAKEGYLNIVTIVIMQVVPAVIIGIVIYYVIEKPMLNALRTLLERARSTPAPTTTEPRQS